MNFVYARVSTLEQNVEQQVELLKQSYSVEKVFVDKQSGKDLDRPEFQRMKEQLRSGDTVIAYDISRLGRNVLDVLDFAQYCQEQGIKLVIDQLGQTDVTSATGKLVLTTLAAVAEMQRSEMLEKQAIGIQRAKAEGKYKGRPVGKQNLEKVKAVNAMIAGGMSAAEAIRQSGISKATYYRLQKPISQ